MNFKKWYFDQLEKELKRKDRLSIDRIELINPEANKRLDQRLLNDFWPPIQSTIDDSPFYIPDNCLRNGKPDIRNEYNPLPHRSFFFIIENPENPIHPDNTFRNWFARIKVDAISDHYYMELEYFLYFPKFVGFEKIRKLMCHPDFQEIPPELSWSEGFPETDGVFSLDFHFGSGTSWTYSPNEEWTDLIIYKIKTLLSLVETSESAALNLYNKSEMEQLENALVRVWELWTMV